MANTISALSDSGGPWEPTPNRKRWTRKECEFLEQNDLLTERYELIDGEIIFKMSQNPPHRLTIMLIVKWLKRLFGDEYVCSQGPIEVGVADPEINQPQPDIVVQSLPDLAFATRLPGPTDLLLVVEVSDSTLRFDLHNKARLYAPAGIVEYWVADIGNRRLVAHRSPSPTGYTDITEYFENETVSLLARPEIRVRVSDLLPPAQP